MRTVQCHVKIAKIERKNNDKTKEQKICVANNFIHIEHKSNRPSLIPSELTSWSYQWKVIWVDSEMNQPSVHTVPGPGTTDQPN